MEEATLVAINVEQKYIRELFERNQIILQQAEKIKELEAKLNGDKAEEDNGKK